MERPKHTPTVGIFMPAYNQGKYIDEALESLRKQTFQNFIIHIVDDGSNDNFTAQKIASIKYDKAKIFPNNTNKGVAFRFRQHCRLLKGDYIFVLCADDKLAPSFIEKTVDYMEKHSKCGAVGTNIMLFYDNNKTEIEFKFNKNNLNKEYMISKNNMLGSSLMRRIALETSDLSGGFVRYQDWDRWISMMEAGWDLGLIEEPLFYYRQHEKSLSHSASVEDEMEIHRKMLKKHKALYEKNYQSVILEIYKNLHEVQSGKNWLEQQYYNLTNEVDRLNKIIENTNRKAQKGIVSRIKNKLRRLLKKISINI